MKGSSYDTRFLAELFYSPDRDRQRKTRETLHSSKPNYLSTIALSEIYAISLTKDGRTSAEIRAKSIMQEFHLVDVDAKIALEAASIRHQQRVPLADSLIAATAKLLDVPCWTDDPHYRTIKGLRVKWFE